MSLGCTEKESTEVVAPPALVTVIGPETAELGTVALSWVVLTTVKRAVAVACPKVTLVVLEKV